MKTLFWKLPTLVVLSALLPAVGLAADNTDNKAIRAQLSHYEHALNQSDSDSIMKLYAKDAVFYAAA